MDERLRVFCAVEVTDAIRLKVAEHVDRLKKIVPSARPSWTSQDKLHITLKFLGDTDKIQVATLSEACSRVVAQNESFELQIQGCGAFFKKKTPQVLWLGIEDSTHRLASLQSSLESECVDAGFPKDERSFSPHLTIARIRRPAGAVELALTHQNLNFAPIQLPVNELQVVRSVQSNSGSRYDTLSRHLLRKHLNANSH